MKSNKTVFFPLLFLVACGPQVEHGPEEVKASSVIVGELDWKEVTEFHAQHPVRKNSHPVAEVRMRSGGRCTGFLISEDVLMTNDHCVSTQAQAVGLTATFRYEAGVPAAQRVSVECSEFLGSNQQLDYALVRCKGQPGATFGWVELSDEAPKSQDGLYIIQQNCDYFTDRSCSWTKKFASGVATRVNGSSIVHNADTLGGSSGSPVFREADHRVMAIHHAGLGNNGRGRGIENYSISMSEIVPEILSLYPFIELKGFSNRDDDQDVPEHTSVEHALELVSGEFELVNSGDSHFYKFSFSERSLLDVAIYFSHRAGDLDLYLYTEDGRLIARSNGVTNTERLRGFLQPGAYILSVVGYRGAIGAYSIESKN
jgi:V8-like Glu-specific endopeptidase